MEINFHDVLHGFWVGRGTDTSALEFNMIQHLTAIMEAVLYEVFMDPQKAYDALDCYRFIEIIVVYRVGPWALRTI